MVSPKAKRQAIRYVQDAWHYSERQACRVVGTSRSTVRYQARQWPDEALLRRRIRELANEHKSHGYVSSPHCYVVRAFSSTRNACTVYGKTKVYNRPVVVSPHTDMVRLARRCRKRHTVIMSGAKTLSRTAQRTAARFGFWVWSTSSRENVCRCGPIAPSRQGR